MAVGISSNNLVQSLSRTFHRYNIVGFAVIASLGVAAVVLLLSQIIATALDSSTDVTASSQSFDQATIKKLEELRPSGEPSQPLVIPPGTRSSPFVE